MHHLLALVFVAAPFESKLSAALELEKQGSGSDALVQVEQLVAADPTWELARVEAARLAVKLGTRVERAVWHAEIARSLAPENPRAHFVLALAFDETGQRDAAIRALEVALALRDDYPEARLRLAGLLSSEQRWADAVRQWRLYLRSTPEATGARLQLAQALERAGELKASEVELRSLMRVEAVRYPATRALVALLERTHRQAEAQRLRLGLERPARDLRPLKPSAR